MFRECSCLKCQNDSLDDFGVFYLHIDDASALIAKVLFLEDRLDIKIPEGDFDYSLYSPELDKILIKEIDKYKKLLISGVERGTLLASNISRNIDETIRTNETRVKVDVLLSWLSERNIDLYGDWYEEYAENEGRLAESVCNFIEVQRNKIRSGKRRWELESDQDKIVSLERQINFLIGKTDQDLNVKRPVKPLHVKERDTLLKMIIVMAVKGYAYDPNAKKSSSIKDITDDLASLGISLDADTVRKWIKEAAELLPRDNT